ncbi:MAG: AAA family ATPase [Geminicoccaceae bacterium]
MRLGRDPAPPDTAPAAERRAQRRHLTLAFVDLVESTALATRLDPEELREVLVAFQTAVARAVEHYGGHVLHLEGDGVLACFGWPAAYEDDAERAVRASQAAVAAVGRLRPAGVATLVCRAGIATGTVVVVEQQTGPKLYGDALHLATRLHAFGPPGGIVLAASTRRALGDLFAVASLGTRLLKGSEVPVEAWHLLGEDVDRSRFLALRGPAITPLVGRQRELDLLLDRWCHAEEGTGRIVVLVGEAGIGKSRLVEALRKRLAAARHVELSLFCSPHFMDTALYPVRRLLERAARLRHGEPPDRQADRLERLLAQAADRVRDGAPLLADLLAIPAPDRYPAEALTPQQRKDRTLLALLDQLAGLAARRPVLLLCEDAHWADPSTHELLRLIAEQVPRLPVLLVVTQRPEAGGFSHEPATTLALQRLERHEAAMLLAELAADRVLEPEVARNILDRAEGMPLYVEELTRAVLAGPAHGGGVAGTPQTPAVPVTLQGSLLARLDRLPGAKDVAQIGAVIGREFRRDVLVAATGMPDRLIGPALHRLVDAGLLARNDAEAGESYAFRHALLADAAYDTLLRSRRRELHAQVARALEGSFPEIGADYPEVLAHHCALAGMAGDAVRYRCRAGERAAQRFANVEALEHYRHAVALLPELPAGPARERTELTIRTAMGALLMAAKGYSAPEVRQAYDRAHELCLAVDAQPAEFPVLFGLSLYYLVRSELRAARPLVARCLVAARTAGDPDLMIEACCVAGPAEVYRGRFVAARRVLDRGLALYRPERHREHAARYGQDPMLALGFIARVEAMLGRPDRARLRSAELLAWLRSSDEQPNSIAILHAQLAHAHLLLREPVPALEQAEATVAVASRHGLPLWLGLGRMYRGAALVESGLTAGDPATIRHGLADGAEGSALYQTTGALLDVPSCLCWFAAGSLRLGDLEGAARQLGDARRLIAATGQSYFAAELERLGGKLCGARQRPDPVAASAQFELAIAIAHGQGARLLELRAATDLFRQAQERDTEGEARARLQALCDRFPKDAHCRDLTQARAALGGT